MFQLRPPAWSCNRNKEQKNEQQKRRPILFPQCLHNNVLPTDAAPAQLKQTISSSATQASTSINFQGQKNNGTRISKGNTRALPRIQPWPSKQSISTIFSSVNQSKQKTKKSRCSQAPPSTRTRLFAVNAATSDKLEMRQLRIQSKPASSRH